MSYDEIEIEDMDWSDKLQAFTYSCPCGDLFSISVAELAAGETIARCPSCSLYITVVFDEAQLKELSGADSLHGPVVHAVTA